MRLKISSNAHDLKTLGPCLVVCDSMKSDKLFEMHSRQVGDSRDFPDQIKWNASFKPRQPTSWRDCEVKELKVKEVEVKEVELNEVEAEEVEAEGADANKRSIVKRILRIFRSEGRDPPTILARDVFSKMADASKIMNRKDDEVV